jgi:hypothetical protein
MVLQRILKIIKSRGTNQILVVTKFKRKEWGYSEYFLHCADLQKAGGLETHCERFPQGFSRSGF